MKGSPRIFGKYLVALACVMVLVGGAAPSVEAQTIKKIKEYLGQPQPDRLDAYLKMARVTAPVSATTTGSLWRANTPLSDMAADLKARYVGDEVTIALAESTTSAQQGSVQTARTFAASSNIAAFFGKPGINTAIQNLFSPNSSQTLNGKGQTALTTSLATTLGAIVMEVLPNGLLVIQAQRQVRATDQTETMTLRGIVRPADLSPNNVVFSTQISHLEVTLEGSGVITEGTHPPNIVVRVLLRVLGF
jgi:flagellar L-ring protein FlgH